MLVPQSLGLSLNITTSLLDCSLRLGMFSTALKPRSLTKNY